MVIWLPGNESGRTQRWLLPRSLGLLTHPPVPAHEIVSTTPSIYRIRYRHSGRHCTHIWQSRHAALQSLRQDWDTCTRACNCPRPERRVQQHPTRTCAMSPTALNPGTLGPGQYSLSIPDRHHPQFTFGMSPCRGHGRRPKESKSLVACGSMLLDAVSCCQMTGSPARVSRHSFRRYRAECHLSGQLASAPDTAVAIAPHVSATGLWRFGGRFIIHTNSVKLARGAHCEQGWHLARWVGTELHS
jgi:hypothetical protein